MKCAKSVFVVLGFALLSPAPFPHLTPAAHAQNQTWITQFGTSSLDYVQALAPDGAGGVMVAGSTNGDLGGPNAGGSDAFVARYDGTGSQLWLRQIGTEREDFAYGLALGEAGTVFIAGSTEGSLGGTRLGFSDVFLARYITGACYPDCDLSTGVGIFALFDFLCWQNSFVLGEPYACDCDTSTGPLVCDVFDFLCFQNAFVGGCP